MIKIRKNPDVELANEVQKAVNENDGFCPCKIRKTVDTKCMCKEFIQQTEPGLCHCGLYEKYDDNDIEVNENLVYHKNIGEYEWKRPQ